MESAKRAAAEDVAKAAAHEAHLAEVASKASGRGTSPPLYAKYLGGPTHVISSIW